MPSISKYSAQKKLSMVWFVGSAILIVIFLLISIPRVKTSYDDNYNWLINNLNPSLSLIISAFIYSANNRDTVEMKTIDLFFVRLVTISSFFYLGFLIVILLLTPFAERQNISFIEHIKRFSLIISFIQTLLMALLGIFFMKEGGK